MVVLTNEIIVNRKACSQLHWLQITRQKQQTLFST